MFLERGRHQSRVRRNQKPVLLRRWLLVRSRPLKSMLCLSSVPAAPIHHDLDRIPYSLVSWCLLHCASLRGFPKLHKAAEFREWRSRYHLLLGQDMLELCWSTSISSPSKGLERIFQRGLAGWDIMHQSRKDTPRVELLRQLPPRCHGRFWSHLDHQDHSISTSCTLLTSSLDI